MSNDMDNSLFIDFSLSRFYQHLLGGIGSYHELGNRIIRDIKAAHAFRQAERVRELARILVNIPIKECQLIGQYYLVWCQCRRSQYDAAALEKIVEQTKTYKAKALITMAAFEVYKGNIEHALYFYTEALKTNPTLSDYIKASTGIATVKSMEGFHGSALKDIENLLTLLGYGEPLNFFEVTNSYAVELGQAGRKDEARNVIKHVLASPFALAYPECKETGMELGVIGCKDTHSYVSVKALPEREVKTQTKPHKKEKARPKNATQAARVISFPQLKEAPQPQKPDRVASREYVELTANDRRELIFAALKSGEIAETHYYKLAVMLGLIKFGPADKIIDLEDDELLDDIAIMWSRQIGIEEFVGFLSALRDCDDEIRQRDILSRWPKDL